MRNPDDDITLSDGHGLMVTDAPYKAHLQVAKEIKEVSELELLRIGFSAD